MVKAIQASSINFEHDKKLFKNKKITERKRFQPRLITILEDPFSLIDDPSWWYNKHHRYPDNKRYFPWLENLPEHKEIKRFQAISKINPRGLSDIQCQLTPTFSE